MCYMIIDKKEKVMAKVFTFLKEKALSLYMSVSIHRSFVTEEVNLFLRLWLIGVNYIQGRSWQLVSRMDGRCPVVFVQVADF